MIRQFKDEDFQFGLEVALGYTTRPCCTASRTPRR